MSHHHDVEESETLNNSYSRAVQSQFVGQWITSLAISVICCAILFVVFAGYMVRLHEKTNLAEIRIELLQEKNNQIVADIAALRRMPPQTIFNLQGLQAAPAVPPVAAAPAQPEPPAAGVKIEEESAKIPELAPASAVEPAPERATPPAENKAAKSKIDLGVPAYNPPEKETPIVR